MYLRAQSLTKDLKQYDRDLYCEVVVNREGVPQIQVRRMVNRFEVVWLDNETYIYALRRSGDYLFSLTENWTVKADPVDWGFLPIINKIRSMDRWNRGGVDLFEEMQKENERIEASEERGRKNLMEEWAREMHPIFKKATSDINTAGMKETRPKKD